MSPRIIAFVLTLVVVASTARATFVPAGETIALASGHTERDPIVVGVQGALLLTTPGTYTAPSWSIHGELRLGAPGTYTVIASTGSIVLTRTSAISGTGNVSGIPFRLTFAHAGDFSLSSGQLDTTIAVTQGLPPQIDSPPLVNISTRARLAAGQIHTSGFVIGGKMPRRVLVRAIGPTLATFGVANVLATPVLTVYNNQQPLRTNSGWGGDSILEGTFTVVGAFPLPASSRDAAILLDLNPGSYTVQVGGGTGEMLLEIYHVE